MEHITTTQVEQIMETVVTLGNFDGAHLGHRALPWSLWALICILSILLILHLLV